jgi:D-inositol-3-phosphate glycosyltransferase
MARKRLLAIGHAGRGFGFGRVLAGILGQLPDGWDVHQFELSPGAAGDVAWTVHPNTVPGDFFGLQQLALLLPRLRPDVVLIVKDLWFVPDYLALAKQSSHAEIVAYCPIDGELQAHTYLGHLGRLDLLVLFTGFARGAVERALCTGGCTPPIEIVPHGLDRERFFPLDGTRDPHERRRRARQELMPERPEIADGFIVLNANRNQPRKAVATTLAAFARFAADKPDDVKLYLHMGMRDEGPDLAGLAAALGIADRLLATTRERAHPQITDAELNAIYNACEVGVNTSMGEGWGLVAFEHAATGAAQIVPCHSACAELWREDGILLAAPHAVHGEVIVGREVDPDALVDALERCYADRTYLTRMSEAARRNAERQLSWSEVGYRFDSLFTRLLESN